MSSPAPDFIGHRVLVVGGTSGSGHAIARGFVDAGAHVTVTGTYMLRELYDADLSGMSYDMVNLARQDSIDHIVAATPRLDVLVLAAGCHLPADLEETERDFLAGAVSSGILGPMFLATRLRRKLGHSILPGGGCILLTGSTRRWLELSMPPEESTVELATMTARDADTWSRLGVRINCLVEPARTRLIHRQAAPGATGARGPGGDTLVREPMPRLEESVADLALFLAGRTGARLSGQTFLLN